MTIINRNQAPYYDDYDPSKNYSHMLAVPGRVEQAREFTQIQTMIYDYLQRLSDSLFKSGAIISGMGFTMKESTILVESGKVYVGGKIHNFNSQEIPVTKVGEESIGVKLVQSIVTENEDISLLDPTTATGNYGQPGTHRIKNEIVLTVNDSESSIIYQFMDGNLQAEVVRPQFDGISELLARRTYDESGNYKVNGLGLVSEQYDANNTLIVVEAGTAYIKGYQVIKPTPIKKIVPMAKDTRSVIGEPKVYSSSFSSDYRLNNFPAKNINKVTAYVQVTQTITRGSMPNSMDYLNKTPVVSIISVVAGGTTYTTGVDYQLTTDAVDWSLTGAEPTAGSTYQVTYTYNKTLVPGTDYSLYQQIDAYGATVDYLRFLAGDKPNEGTTFYIDYDFYLARADLISMDKDGNIVVTPGQSDITRNVKPPGQTDPTLLTLGHVFLPPNTGKGVAYNNSVTRMDMFQLQRMAKRIDDLEFNQAITALDKEAIEGEIPTDLRGVFSDSFRSTARADLTHPNFNIMYQLEDGTLRLPYENLYVRSLSVDYGTSNIKKWGTMVSALMTEKAVIDQRYATTTMNVNPYLAFNAFGSLTLNPPRDNWFDDTYIKIENEVTTAKNFVGMWSLRNDNIFRLLSGWATTSGDTIGDWGAGLTGSGGSRTAIKTEKSKEILSEAITYMRQTTIQLSASNLQPATDNLECFFDGKKVPLTPVSGYSSGSTPGTVRANSVGEVKATFTIPPEVRTGTREVVLRNASNTATTGFTSVGFKRDITETITTQRVTLTVVDPLAQTFQFDRDTTLTSVGVYFSSKASNSQNIVCQIRNVVNGYPGNIIYGEKVLSPGQITVSANSGLETKITFDDPIVCEANTQYCMAFLTDNGDYSMFVADLGQKDILTGVSVNNQPYLAGMLFSSSNSVAWTAHQSMNMKFKVYAASYAPTATINYQEVSGIDVDSLILMISQMAPSGTSCRWEVSLDGGSYLPITPETDTDLIKVANKAKIRAIMATNGNMSPMVLSDNAVLVGLKTGMNGTYIGRNVELEQQITNVKQVYDVNLPNGCSATAQFSYDNGSSWITPPQVSQEVLSTEYTRITCEYSIPGGVVATDYRARINLSSNNRTLRPKIRRFVNIMK